MRDESLWGALCELYTEDEARTFLCTPQSFLGGMTPAEAIARDGQEGEMLLDWIEGCNAQTAT